MKLSASKKIKEFLPFNSSILTRILAQDIQDGRVLTLSHLPHAALRKHLAFGQNLGLFNGTIDWVQKVYGDANRLTKKKLNQQ